MTVDRVLDTAHSTPRARSTPIHTVHEQLSQQGLVLRAPFESGGPGLHGGCRGAQALHEPVSAHRPTVGVGGLDPGEVGARCGYDAAPDHHPCFGFLVGRQRVDPVPQAEGPADTQRGDRLAGWHREVAAALHADPMVQNLSGRGPWRRLGLTEMAQAGKGGQRR